MKIESSTQHLDKDQIITILRKNKKILEKQFGVTTIALFGSYARGEETETSDIDLLIEAKEHKFRNRLKLQKFLEEFFGKKVDVGYFSSVRGFIMHHIKKELMYA